MKTNQQPLTEPQEEIFVLQKANEHLSELLAMPCFDISFRGVLKLQRKVNELKIDILKG